MQKLMVTQLKVANIELSLIVEGLKVRMLWSFYWSDKIMWLSEIKSIMNAVERKVESIANQRSLDAIYCM